MCLCECLCVSVSPGWCRERGLGLTFSWNTSGILTQRLVWYLQMLPGIGDTRAQKCVSLHRHYNTTSLIQCFPCEMFQVEHKSTFPAPNTPVNKHTHGVKCYMNNQRYQIEMMTCKLNHKKHEHNIYIYLYIYGNLQQGQARRSGGGPGGGGRTFLTSYLMANLTRSRQGRLWSLGGALSTSPFKMASTSSVALHWSNTPTTKSLHCMDNFL